MDLATQSIFQTFEALYGTRFNILRRITPLNQPIDSAFDTQIEYDEDAVFDDGPLLDGVVREGTNPDNPTNLVSSEAKVYKVPEDLMLFHRNYITGVGPVRFAPLSTLVGAYVTLVASLMEDGNNVHYGTDLYFRHYFIILHDEYSVDNGHGQLYMNMNPEAADYGHVYAHSSGDEGQNGRIATSFVNFIQLMIKKNNKTCASVVDCINNVNFGNLCVCDVASTMG